MYCLVKGICVLLLGFGGGLCVCGLFVFSSDISVWKDWVAHLEAEGFGLHE